MSFAGVGAEAMSISSLVRDCGYFEGKSKVRLRQVCLMNLRQPLVGTTGASLVAEK
jgi:hypothetical protein